jgi:hypothetical protein
MIGRVLLLGLNGLSLTGALWLFLASPDLPRVTPATDRPKSSPVAPLQFPASDGSDVPMRSLFRPIPPPPAPAPPPEPVVSPPVHIIAPAPPAEPLLRLVGLIGRSDDVTVLIEVQGTAGIQRRRSGEIIEGWHIAEIGRRGILLRRGEQSKFLALDPPGQP